MLCLNEKEYPACHWLNRDEPMDVSDWAKLVEWCASYHKYHLPQDTGDALYRWNISVYQLKSVREMIVIGNYDALEWAECTGAAFIHAVAALANSADSDTVDRRLMFNIDLAKAYASLQNTPSYENKTLCCYSVLAIIPSVTKQMLYRAMGRKHRYNEDELFIHATGYLLNVMRLISVDNCCYDIASALRLGLSKLTNAELRTH